MNIGERTAIRCRRAAVSAALALSVLLVACGGSSQTSAIAADPSASARTAEEAPTPEAVSSTDSISEASAQNPPHELKGTPGGQESPLPADSGSTQEHAATRSTPKGSPPCERPAEGSFEDYGEPDPAICLALRVETTTVVQGETFEGTLVFWNRTDETVPYQGGDCGKYEGLYQDGQRKGGEAGHIACTALPPPPNPFEPGERRELTVDIDTWNVCELLPPGRYLAGAAPDGKNEGHHKYWFAPGIEVTIKPADDPPSPPRGCE